jgi:pimeloyl-ACP methyl ester carboxylesterase
MRGHATSPDDVMIGYETQGNGAPALVFVHGWSCDRRYWREQVEPLGAHHQVVAVDLAGHGESGTGRSDWTIRAFGGDVVSVVNELDLAEVVLVGHSMGGDVIVDAALQIGDRVRGLVWVDTYDDLDEPSSPEAISTFLAPFRENFGAATRAFVRTMFLPGADPELVEWVSADMAAAPPAIALDVAVSSLSNGRAIPGLLRELQAPVVAINTGWLRPDVGSLRRHGVESLVLADLGHFPMLEEPTRFNGVLREVVNRLSSARG